MGGIHSPRIRLDLLYAGDVLMRHGCLYWLLVGWWWGIIRFVLLAYIGVICAFLALPVWFLAKAVKLAKNGI